MSTRREITFKNVETGSLRAVYLLAISALGFTHDIDEVAMIALADAVFQAYTESECLALPLSSAEMEEMAVLSIDVLLHSENEPFMLKR